MLNRIEKSKRTFHSEIIENYILETTSKFKSQNLKNIFTNCYPNTLDTTIDFDPVNNDTFIITGDIKAMWLRDSSFQIFPYLMLLNRFCLFLKVIGLIKSKLE